MQQQNNKEIDILEITRLLWKQRKKIIKWGVIGLLCGVIIAFSIPGTYSSTIKIAPEESTKGLSGSAGAFASMMGVNMGATGENGVNKAIYHEIINSSPFVLEFLDIEVVNNQQKTPLWHYLIKEQSIPWWNYILGLPTMVISSIQSIFNDSQTTHSDIHNNIEMQNDFIGAFLKSIKYNSDKKTGVITIVTTLQDPVVAKIVADSLIVKLQTYITKYKTSKTRSNLSSNLVMLEQAKEEFYKIDAQYANLVDRNQNITSEKARLKVDRVKDERDLAYQVYQQLGLQVATDRIKLQEDIPIATVIEPARLAINKIAPNKKLIIIASVFFACTVCCGLMVFKKLKTLS